MLLLLFLACLVFAVSEAEDHEIVYPRMIVSRSGDKRVTFRAFDQHFHLKLEPTNVLSDDFVLITRDEKGVVYVKPDVEQLRQSILQDRSIGATVAVDDSGPLKIRGIINDQLRIEPHHPITSTFKKGGKGGKKGGKGGKKCGRHYNELNQEELMENVPHKVTRIVSRSEDSGFFDEVIPPGIKGLPTNSSMEARQSGPINVETAVVSDRMHAKQFRSYQEAITYHAILLNSANARFSSMKKTTVNLILSVVKLNKQIADEPYIYNNMYDNHVLSDRVLPDFAKYCASNKELSSADIVKLVTKQPMGDKEPGTTKANPGVVGIAYVAGVCDRGYKFGVSEDNGNNFDGSSTFAHEVAHLLGSPHDGDGPPSYVPGSPGAKDCPWDDGFIMSYVRNDEKQFAFSRCSEGCIAQVARLKEAGCLFRPDTSPNFSVNDNRLPGQYLSEALGTKEMKPYYDTMCKITHNRDDIASRDLPQNSCKYSCRIPPTGNRYRYWINDCLDGDPCATGKMCKNGICAAF